jgi:RNA polymerase sigma-70 factor (ECF subfamily)
MSELVFAEIFEQYRLRVVAWCYRVSRNHDAANDLAQEVFLKAYRNRMAFRGDSSVSTWLYAIARNHCLTALKRNTHDDLPLDSIHQNALRDELAVNPDRAAEQGDAARRLLRLMTKTLDPLEVRVMTLHYGHEVPLAAITHQLSLSNPSGAKAYIVNGRRKMQAVLKRRKWQKAA